ncbi:type I restriction endonuclease subunit R [Fibrobacter sp. UBA4309]|uniref:type I restriction endonuclease subunit R n=1 Tax=Fibrobacter sp. UBA4309 TaxID=1946537 RepID=UPI0025C1740C|nr:DEAD/DEAH box helicase family protein [Fibrobacter sp. UBA4309]
MKFSINERYDYQRGILNYLKEHNGYRVRTNENFDRRFAIDGELLVEFLTKTQPKKVELLRKMYKGDFEETLFNYFNREVNKKDGSLIGALKHGIDLANQHLDLMYSKPATDFNPELLKNYRENIFSVAEEVWASDDERIDLVIFLNGIAIISFELKSNPQGQNYSHAIEQYRTQRNPKTRLFQFKSGTLVNFAMDLNEVYMTTRLEGETTTFLPFNMGDGNGVNAGKGNPLCEDDYPVHYMWEDILTKDTILDLISRYIFIQVEEKEDKETGKKTKKENIIFPRYHQLDCLRKILADVTENKSSFNYLIQHSAGSGKTNTIAWLSHRFSSLHDKDDKQIFDNVVVVTDRVVVDRQLQAAISGIEHKSGLFKPMKDDCTSDDLRKALEGNTKIIATTIQKFPYIVDTVASLKGKTFAVIIDEAHSSTAGKNMAAITKALGKGKQNEDEEVDVEDSIVDEIKRNGKQENVSFFAFTATPKPTTLQLFGRINKDGHGEAFHTYSMKQAIEEGFILDVLQNYITYKTFYQVNKAIQDDPTLETKKAKRQIARTAELHDTNIAQRVEVIVEHFRTTVMQELDGNAKAMVITDSRQGAVKYRQAMDEYLNKKGYSDIKALVAFSGKVKVDDVEYSEAKMNGFSEDKLPEKFDKDGYQVLLVANKYQTGFDQKKLCAMYILKKLRGVNAVQTLSRLNRICSPYKKQTFILDFKNDYEDMKAAFAPYYTSTFLANSVNPRNIYELEKKIDAYGIIDYDDVMKFNEWMYKGLMDKKKAEINSLLVRAQKFVDKYELEEQLEFVALLRSFVRFYEFMIQVTNFSDVDLHKKYNFIVALLAYLDIRQAGNGFSLKGKIKIGNFVQKKDEEHKASNLVSKPFLKLPIAEKFGLTEDKKQKLSEIIAEINSKNGTAFDTDVAVKAALQIRDIMMKNENLKKSAASNTEKDFAFPFYDNIDDALIEGLDQNESFFSLLLNNNEIKKEVLGIFMGEIYKSLKKKAKEADEAADATANEDATGRIYKMPTQKNEFSDMGMAAEKKKGKKKK